LPGLLTLSQYILGEDIDRQWQSTGHWILQLATQPIWTDGFSLGHTRAQVEVQLEMLSIPHMTRMNFDRTPSCDPFGLFLTEPAPSGKEASSFWLETLDLIFLSSRGYGKGKLFGSQRKRPA
jgi:hypothetical protein